MLTAYDRRAMRDLLHFPEWDGSDSHQAYDLLKQLWPEYQRLERFVRAFDKWDAADYKYGDEFTSMWDARVRCKTGRTK